VPHGRAVRGSMVIPGRRSALTWVGTACLLAALAFVLLWTTLHPRHSPQPSTHLPATPPPAASPALGEAQATSPTNGGVAGPPARPVSATGSTASAAAVLAGAYFTEALNYAKTTGDVSAIRAWSDVSCLLCRRNIGIFAASNQRNGLLTGDHLWRYAHVSQVDLTDATTATVDLSISIGRHKYRSRVGAPPQSLPAQTIDLQATLTLTGGNWVMFDWERVQ
jgi:hypothetical protein